MRIVVAPDGFGGTLTALQAATSIAQGWQQQRPDDEVISLPMSDGGEGLLDVLTDEQAVRRTTEVAGPLGHPLEAPWLLQDDATAVIESAAVCGLHLLDEQARTPMRTTTYGVGQLVDAAREAGARRILLGLGGSATVDGGAGALSGLGFRLRVEDGSGLKIGGEDLHRVSSADRAWSAQPWGVEVTLLADVRTTLLEAAEIYGPQKGASPEDVVHLARGLANWAEVAERDLAQGVPLREQAGSGAAGGLGFGLACGLGAILAPGATRVAEFVGLPPAVADADLVITGEGRLDATSSAGKVVGAVRDLARERGVAVAAVVGQVQAATDDLDAIEAAAPRGPGNDPAAEVRAAAARLADRYR